MAIQDAMPQAGQGEEQATEAPKGAGQVAQIMITNAMNFIHNEKNSQRLVEQAQQMDPVEVAARTIASLLEGMTQSAQKAGQKPGPEDLIEAAKAVAMEIADVFEAAGVIQEGEQEQFSQQSLGRFAQIIEEVQQRGQQGQQQPAQQAPAEGGAGPIGQAMGGM